MGLIKKHYYGDLFLGFGILLGKNRIGLVFCNFFIGWERKLIDVDLGSDL